MTISTTQSDRDPVNFPNPSPIVKIPNAINKIEYLPLLCYS